MSWKKPGDIVCECAVCGRLFKARGENSVRPARHRVDGRGTPLCPGVAHLARGVFRVDHDGSLKGVPRAAKEQAA